MPHIASLESVRFDIPTILYEVGNSWHLEIPVFRLRISGETPQALREQAQRLISSDSQSTHRARLFEVQDLIEDASRPLPEVEEVVAPEANEVEAVKVGKSKKK